MEKHIKNIYEFFYVLKNEDGKEVKFNHKKCTSSQMTTTKMKMMMMPPPLPPQTLSFYIIETQQPTLRHLKCTLARLVLTPISTDEKQFQPMKNYILIYHQH